MGALEQMAVQRDKVRAREEARIINAAKKLGIFDWRITTAELEHMFTNGLIACDPQKQSQLSRLETDMVKTKQKISEEERRLDARRKILLGSFIIAQMEHKPVLKADLIPELVQFLELHKDPKAVERNKDLLKDWLHSGPTIAPTGEATGTEVA